MQPGLIETPNHDVVTTNTPLPPPTTAQHGPGRPRSNLPDARSPLRARSTSSDAQSSGGTASDNGLDVGHLDETLGWLSIAEDKSAAATRAAVAGQRVVDYENAAITAPPRNPRPPPGFKVIHSASSDGVQLTDIPNGSFLPRAGPFPRVTCRCSGPLT
jgi:hypothetical protein